MSNNKQSSVEWLISEIIRHQMTFYGTSSMPLRIIEQAKAMHESEIQQAFDEGNPNGFLLKTGEEYYNETYGGNNEQTN